MQCHLPFLYTHLYILKNTHQLFEQFKPHTRTGKNQVSVQVCSDRFSHENISMAVIPVSLIPVFVK